VGPSANVDALLDYRFAALEIPQQRVVAAYSEVQTVTVREDIIFRRRFESRELSIGEAEVFEQA